MRKFAAMTAVVVGVVVMPTAAFAGEITGNGKLTPVDGFQAGSICAYLGQNDDPTGGGDPFQAGRVQNWGATVNVAKELLATDDRGVSSLASVIRVEGPGTNCRGLASQG